MIKSFIKLILVAVLLLPTMQSQAQFIILTSDQQLNDLLDPDKKIDMSLGYTKRIQSLREVCENGQKRGATTLTIAFDEFFRQYRGQAGTERLLTPDMDEYVEKIKVIADFAAGYGLGMGLSLLSPLELGNAFKKQKGENGGWLHYKVGLRDPNTGKFNVQLWQQTYWTNNKGKFSIGLKGVKAYAFKEKKIPDTRFKAVDRNEIVELDNVKFDQWDISVDSNENNNTSKRINIFSEGNDALKGYNKVLVVLEYDVPEIEYFSPEALPFLKELLKKYHDNGIKIKHFYSDEMHIQQDWFYFDHHDNGQFSQRYYTKNLGDLYTSKFGVPFEEKDILYFVYGPDIDSKSTSATQNVQYVMGESREEINKTYLFRDRYYKLLNSHVTDLFKDAKTYASELFGVDDFGTYGHSSWAQSPTIDSWNIDGLELNSNKYEYTPNFIWGNTVHQASAGCYDYFKWGEYLEPTRNDFAEGGWNDRNYYGAAMSTSIGVVNRIPNSYPAFWGMPKEVAERKGAINDAYGGRPNSKSIDLITGHVHRDVDVLILYPMNLVAVEERFGSWITQYGYANFITAEKLLELGSIQENGTIKVKEKTYSTLVALFEPIPQKGILDMMSDLSQKGGKAFWFGVPPVINGDGEPCLEKWQDIFGVQYNSPKLSGQIAAGKRIDFVNQLENTPSQYILTDFIIDRIYPVNANGDVTQLAYCDTNLLVGTENNNAYYFGFRPRDDQSSSLGYETRTLFEILDKTGAYKPTGVFVGINDNTEHVSRTTDYLATRFPNSTTVLVKHYRHHRENWAGGFSRNEEEDKRALDVNPLPSDEMKINNLKVNGHTISYKGKLTMAFRMNEDNELIAFDGQNCNEVEIDGKKHQFSVNPVQKLAFAPSLDKDKKELKILVKGEGQISIPLTSTMNLKTIKLLDKDGKTIKFSIDKNTIIFDVNKELSNTKLTLKYVN